MQSVEATVKILSISDEVLVRNTKKVVLRVEQPGEIKPGTELPRKSNFYDIEVLNDSIERNRLNRFQVGDSVSLVFWINGQIKFGRIGQQITTSFILASIKKSTS